MSDKIFTTIILIVLLVIVHLVAADEEEQGVSINRARAQHPLVSFSTDYVRCFCNLPSCVSTGYMCKSKIGGCFSNFLDLHSRDYRGRHGCLELLNDKEHRTWCEDNPREITNIPHIKKSDPKSLISCCHNDLCNHVDSQQTRSLINSTLLGLYNEKLVNQPDNQPEPSGYTDSEVWFRAATIAVPICGAVILFMLIAVAVKILKSENQNSSNQKLGPLYLHQHEIPSHSKLHCDKYAEYENIFRKPYVSHQNRFYDQDNLQKVEVPLLLPNEITSHHLNSNKNETNAKLNLIHCESNYLESGKSIILDIEKDSNPSDINLIKCSNEKTCRKS